MNKNLTATASEPGTLHTQSPQTSYLVLARAAARTLLVAALVLISGCAFNRQYATTSSMGTNNVATVTVAKSTTLALGDAKTIVDKTRASAGKTSSVGASGINEEATTANVATNARALTELLNALK